MLLLQTPCCVSLGKPAEEIVGGREGRGSFEEEPGHAGSRSGQGGVGSHGHQYVQGFYPLSLSTFFFFDLRENP